VSWLTKIKLLFMLLKYKNAWSFPVSVLLAFLKAEKPFLPTTTADGVVFHATFPPLGSKSLGRYLHGVKNLTKGKHVPLEVHISLTDNCAYKCPFCSNIPSAKQNPTLASLQKTIASVKEAGAAVIAFTGGEPGARQDLAQIMGMCGNDIHTILYTSGQGLDQKKIRKLKLAGLGKIYISLDHFKPEIHNKLRGSQKAFDQALETIKHCQQEQIYTILQAVIHPELNNAGKLAVQEVMFLEPKSVRSRASFPSSSDTQLRLRELQLQRAKKRLYPKVSTMSFLESKEFMGCAAGVSFIYISASGEVFPCDLAPLSFGNIRTESLANILERLKLLIPAPSQKCLSETLHDAYQTGKLPIPWNLTKEIMKNYAPGPPPGLMKWFRAKKIV
jgi:MoaA/NifB/PqqE/SkfB family radical SAM enzyme